MIKKYYKILFLISLFVLSFIYYKSFISADISLITRLRGMILLQVEKNGEAWYIDTHTDERYFLGKPADAYAIMRDLGEGITNKDIEKIPVAEENITGYDSDQDGLSDAFEDAVGTNVKNNDSDNDGFNDKTEIFNNYNPNGNGKLPIDLVFAKKQTGKILIQVEGNGEAWYIYPKNNKRYFLGRPEGAFNIMSHLGLGIKDVDLAAIPKHSVDEKTQYDYLIKNYTATSTTDSGKIIYDEKDLPFTFAFPSNWKIKKSDDFQNVIFLGDYEKNLFGERKAMITLTYINSNKDLILDNFNIAKKEKASKTVNEFSELNKYKTYKQQFEYSILNSYEIITIIQKSPREFLHILLISGGEKNIYDKIYNDLLNSIVLK